MDRTQAINYIQENFTNLILDCPWEDTPEYFVFRHSDNRKWFALFMTVNAKVLHLDQTGSIHILNLKADPDLIEELTHQPYFLPAYHMNKQNWITIILDSAAPRPQIENLIAQSFTLTA